MQCCQYHLQNHIHSAAEIEHHCLVVMVEMMLLQKILLLEKYLRQKYEILPENHQQYLLNQFMAKNYLKLVVQNYQRECCLIRHVSL